MIVGMDELTEGLGSWYGKTATLVAASDDSYYQPYMLLEIQNGKTYRIAAEEIIVFAALLQKHIEFTRMMEKGKQ